MVRGLETLVVDHHLTPATSRANHLHPAMIQPALDDLWHSDHEHRLLLRNSERLEGRSYKQCAWINGHTPVEQFLPGF